MARRLLPPRHRLSGSRPGERLSTIDQWRGLALRPAFRLALTLCVLVVSFLAFAPLDGPPLTTDDKANHILAFAVLAGLANGSYPGRETRYVRWTALLGYGLLIEAVQIFLPYREFSWLDLAADALGILVFSTAALSWRWLVRRRCSGTAAKQVADAPER